MSFTSLSTRQLDQYLHSSHGGHGENKRGWMFGCPTDLHRLFHVKQLGQGFPLFAAGGSLPYGRMFHVKQLDQMFHVKHFNPNPPAFLNLLFLSPCSPCPLWLRGSFSSTETVRQHLPSLLIRKWASCKAPPHGIHLMEFGVVPLGVSFERGTLK